MDPTLSQHAPAMKVGGRRLSITARHAPRGGHGCAIANGEPSSPTTSTSTSTSKHPTRDEGSPVDDYPRPAAPPSLAHAHQTHHAHVHDEPPHLARHMHVLGEAHDHHAHHNHAPENAPENQNEEPHHKHDHRHDHDHQREREPTKQEMQRLHWNDASTATRPTRDRDMGAAGQRAVGNMRIGQPAARGFNI